MASKLRDHTIFGRGFNIINTLWRHFRATRSCRQVLSRRDPDKPKGLGSKKSTISLGDLRRGGDGYIVVHGGISLWRSLARLDLIDEYRVTLVPYLAGEGPRLFEDVGKARSLDLLSSTAFSSGLQLEYRRHR